MTILDDVERRAMHTLDKYRQGDPYLMGSWHIKADYDPTPAVVRIAFTLRRDTDSVGPRIYSGSVVFTGDVIHRPLAQMFHAALTYEVRAMLKDMREVVKKDTFTARYGARIFTGPDCPPSKMYFLNREYMYHQGVSDYLAAATKETTPMANNIPDTTEQGDFVLVTIAVPKAILDKGAGSPVLQALGALVMAELPEVIELVPGMRYQYEDSTYEYEIAQVGETEVVLRRRQGNGAGKRGSRLVETRAKVEHDLRSGRAAVVVDEVTA